MSDPNASMPIVGATIDSFDDNDDQLVRFGAVISRHATAPVRFLPSFPSRGELSDRAQLAA